MSAQIHHTILETRFTGVEDNRYGATVHHFRGIPYAKISERFQSPREFNQYDSVFNATKFGPQCPQPEVDVGHLLRLPTTAKGFKVDEHEFDCLNLNITKPRDADTLPVFIWIHGGSQIVTFASASAPVCDPTRLVAESVLTDKPVIFVTFNYRLNVFAFGDGKGEVNLALQDQRHLIKWVVNNIHGFGGDPNNITLAGESAGAVYTHAHMISGAPVQRALLSSGTLSLSPPLPRTFGSQLIARLEEKVNLRTASTSLTIDALVQCKINSMWLQEEESLLNWNVNFAQPLMIGDVEYESVLWRQGIEDANIEDVRQAFEAAGENKETLQELYHFDPSRPSQSRHAALDFLNDARFGLPVHEMYKTRQRAGLETYRYIFDQANPWQSSSRAHHGVDLIMMFNGVDLEFNNAAENVGKQFRKALLEFASGLNPWPTDKTFAYGPHGECKTLTNGQYKTRRRLDHYAALSEMGLAVYNPVFTKLAVGRISLNN